MKTWLKAIVVVCIVVGVVVLLRVTILKPAAVEVMIQPVEKGRVESTVVNSRAGTVKSRLRAGMSPGIAGLVVDIVARKGSEVRKDEVLLRLDDKEHRAQVMLAEAALTAAGAVADQTRMEADQAERQWQRTQALAKEQVVSETLMDQDRTRAQATRAAAAAAAARVQEGEATLDAARAILAKTVMKAPFDGVVLDVTTEVGEWISPSPPGVFIPPVVDLIAPERLYVSAPIDEADVALLDVNLPVRITLDAFRGRSFLGTISYVSSFVETQQEQNRTLEIEAVFTEEDLPDNLLPGLSADLEIILEAHEDVVRVPTYALLEGGRVLVVEQGVLVSRAVEVGLQNWSYAEILSGVVPGESIVVSLDRPEVVAGARVTVSGEAEP